MAENVEAHVLQHPTKFQAKMLRRKKLWHFEI